MEKARGSGGWIKKLSAALRALPRSPSPGPLVAASPIVGCLTEYRDQTCYRLSDFMAMIAQGRQQASAVCSSRIIPRQKLIDATLPVAIDDGGERRGLAIAVTLHSISNCSMKLRSNKEAILRVCFRMSTGDGFRLFGMRPALIGATSHANF